MPWIVYVEQGWRWARLDAQADLLAESARAFSTQHECVADAEKHGCTGYISSEDPER